MQLSRRASCIGPKLCGSLIAPLSGFNLVYKRTRRSTGFTQSFVLQLSYSSQRAALHVQRPTMAADEKNMMYDEKHGSPATSSAEPVAVGHVFKRRILPGFSLEVRQEPSSFAKTKRASNADFDPIPPSKRTWNWGAYVAYWMADGWAVSNWEVGEFNHVLSA